MSGLTFKRLAVWALGMATGFIIAFLIVVVGFPLLKAEEAGITIAEYGTTYFLVTAVPLGIIFVVWLDALLDTRILPD